MRFRLFMVAVALSAVVAQRPAPTLDCWCRCDVVRVLDADTVVANVYLPWGVALVEQSLRPDSWDAWEASKRRQSEAAGIITDEEVEKGKRCKGELEALLKTGTLYVRPGIRERDNYGRLLGEWAVLKGETVIDMRKFASDRGWIRKAAK